MADLAPTPEALLRNLAYLQGDLADDVLRRHLVENARASRKEIEALLESAVAAGELRRDVDVGPLARVVETAIGGSLMTWATYREGTAADWIARDVEAVLTPWLAQRHRSGRSTASAGKRATAGRRRPAPRR
jgi:hypothetical protein